MRALVLVLLAACGGKQAAPAPSNELSNSAPTVTSEPAEVSGLTVFGIEPSMGDDQGGTYHRILGNGFVTPGPRTVKVYFGSRQGTVIRFANDDELIVESPGGKTDETVDVLLIFEPGGERRIPRAFTFHGGP